MNNYVILYIATIDNHANEGKSLNILHKKDRRSSFSHDLLFMTMILYCIHSTRQFLLMINLMGRYDRLEAPLKSLESQRVSSN